METEEFNELAVVQPLLRAAVERYEDLEDLQHTKVAEIDRGAKLYTDGPDALYLLIDGFVRVSRKGHSGRESTLCLLKRDQWFGEACFFNPHSRGENASAMTKCRVMKWGRRELANVPREWLAARLGQLAAERAALYSLRIEEDSVPIVRGRLLQRLNYLVEVFQFSPHEAVVRVPPFMSQIVIATMLGTSREMITAEFKSLRNLGVITRASSKTAAKYGRQGFTVNREKLVAEINVIGRRRSQMAKNFAARQIACS